LKELAVASSSSALQPTSLPAQFLWPLRAVFWVIAVGACLWAFCIAAQMFWAHRYSPDEPMNYIDAVLAADMKNTAALTPLWIEPTTLAWAIGNEAKASTFDVVNGVVGKLSAFPDEMRQRNGQPKQPVSARTPAQALLGKSQAEQVMLAMTANYIFAARTAVFIAALPLAILIYFVAIADGLPARAIRRESAGRESSSLYHRGKLSQAFLVATVYVCFLASPRSINPLIVLIPTVLVCGMLARLQAKFYKKYL
jgi:integrating conjugative element membrane protein (TIGR03747 family)